ncbi:NAD P-binding protein [Gloeophyllum trabeum ATCC 11539]|uniref:NAD P-binding protein n=1 Tax=Gloeophyllum trabeum (strain ATCC 11539 / FP-39264 / Madison 617) TaxID=670483 RepID=S7Q0R9_GLOTA|nr:NAD P-binding protein [Gloeophyllum trabeum ATCC 11539]EPQ53516.1 NAD P-binding protein [Gloeophyllum trabeum ATCC 11539]
MADEGQVWLITGTTSGFGRRLVDQLLVRGDRVIATARSLDKLKDLEARPESPVRLRCLQLDVTAAQDVINCTVQDAINDWGRIDVLVNNAGFAMPGLLEEAGAEGAMHQFDTNYFGVVRVTTAVLSHMRERSFGTIVIIGSRSAWKADIPGVGHYAASKAAVHAYGETLAAEVARFNIKVLIVAPGLFRTEGIHTAPPYPGAHIPMYDPVRERVLARFADLRARTREDIGDPEKAMRVLVDVVKGQGKAEGKKWPLFLVIGEDAEEDVRKHGRRMEGLMEEWGSVTRDTGWDTL